MAESGVLWGGKTARDESFLRNLLNFEAREKYWKIFVVFNKICKIYRKIFQLSKKLRSKLKSEKNPSKLLTSHISIISMRMRKFLITIIHIKVILSIMTNQFHHREMFSPLSSYNLEKRYERAYTHNIPLFIMAIIIIQQQHLTLIVFLLLSLFLFVLTHENTFFILLLISFCLSPFNNRSRSDFFEPRGFIV